MDVQVFRKSPPRPHEFQFIRKRQFSIKMDLQLLEHLLQDVLSINLLFIKGGYAKVYVVVDVV